MKVKSQVIVLMLLMGFFSNFIKSNIKSERAESYIKIGQILYPNDSSDIKNCVQLYLTDKNKFEEEYTELVEEFDVIFGESSLTYLLYSYGESKGKVAYIDWRGEENEGEIETYINKILNEKIEFSNTALFRQKSKDTDTRDGEYILKLFNHINSDLKKRGLMIAFFNEDWDAYGFTIVSADDFQLIDSTLAGIIKEN